MKSDRIILHSDLNCFYASVEIMLNPALRGKPVAVCGNTQDRHGIVLAKSQPAKLAGVLSEGMLLCAEDENGELSLMVPEKKMPSGAEIA